MADPVAPSTTHTNPAPSTAQTAIAAQLQKLFPDGRLPEPTQLRSGELAVGNPAYQAPTGPSAPTGATGAAPAAATGAPTGATGAAPAAATGVTGPIETGPTGPIETGPTGPIDIAPSGPAISGPTKEQLDAAGSKMEVKAGTAFKHVRDLNAQLTADNNLLLAKLKDLEGKAPTEADKTVVADLQAKIDRYEKELSVSKVESTDAFIKNVTKPLEKASNELKAMATKYDVAPGALAAALGETDINKRSDMLAELSTNFNRIDQTRLERLVTEIDQKLELRQTEITQAAENYKRLQAEADKTAKKAATDFQQNWVSALDTSFSQLEKEPFFKLSGDATKDAPLIKLRDAVRTTDVSKLSNEELATNLYKAGAFPIILGLITESYAENVQLSDQLTKLRGTTPPVGGGIVPTPVPANTVQPTDSFRDTMKSKLVGVLPP